MKTIQVELPNSLLERTLVALRALGIKRIKVFEETKAITPTEALVVYRTDLIESAARLRAGDRTDCITQEEMYALLKLTPKEIAEIES